MYMNLEKSVVLLTYKVWRQEVFYAFEPFKP